MDTLIANVVGLLGMAALAWPAIAADRLAARLLKIETAARHEDTDRFFTELRDQLRAHLPPNSWRPRHRVLLYGGYLLLLAAAILRMIPAD